MSTSSTATTAEHTAQASTFGIPSYTKLTADGTPLPPTAETWAAVRVSLGDQAFDVLVGNIGGRTMTQTAGIEACRTIDALGTQDWRLWTRREAEAVLDLDRWKPAVDPTFFPDIKPEWYWTASADASDPEYAWDVYFLYGYAYLSPRGLHGFVRAVRSVSPASARQ